MQFKFIFKALLSFADAAVTNNFSFNCPKVFLNLLFKVFIFKEDFVFIELEWIKVSVILFIVKVFLLFIKIISLVCFIVFYISFEVKPIFFLNPVRVHITWLFMN